jgi:hypothetical protein
MIKPRRVFLHGAELLRALASMKDAVVKWLVGDQSFHIPANQALCIARASAYEGKFNKGRVYFIREVITRPVPVFDEEYRRDRAVLRWDKPVDLKTVTLWDRILATV